MKTKRILLSVFAVLLIAVMLSGVIAVGYDVLVNSLGNRVVIDKDNNLPVVKPKDPINSSASASVTTENGVTTSEVTLKNDDESIFAVIPEGTLLNDGVTKVTLSVKEITNGQANIELDENEEKSSFDVHVEGVSASNTTPIKVYVKEMLPVGLNMGNYKLYHVENGATVEMALLNGEPVHNSFTYDSVTGDVNLYLASFSEVAVVADTVNAWNGDVKPFAGGTGTKDDPYIIANADQLAYFGKVVGGMDGYNQKTFDGEYVKLVADINLGDKDNANESLIFHPIGYYYTDDNNGDGTTGDYFSTVYSFEGTFNGNGHTISNFYQNTWEIKGDYSGNYYSDAMGLFGYVVGGTVQNLTVDNFSSDGEFTPTGVIAAYAVNSTFENIAITNCNPRVYNTGNGGIVGIGGNSDDPDTYSLNFSNITVDNTNKISALWGSWDVACGGLMGMYRGYSSVNFTNCHVAAQIDVYNDVCGNYQYYWYRYAGMMIGSLRGRNTVIDGYTVPDTSSIKATNCTVHFGEWNNYYYCELVANTLASYTHDHQFSRLEQISSLDEIKNGNVWTREGNFLIINGNTKTCYHIVSKNGELVQHSHDDYNGDGINDFEIVNGEEIPVENNRIVFLPFNQLFQGDGWGVKHIPIYNDDKTYFVGITILDREVANSVVKFEGVANDNSYTTNTTVTIGDLFKAITGIDVDILGANVQVTVSPVGENSTANGTYEANTTNWAQGTLTFTGFGEATITITDYYFCTPTTITVVIEDRQPVDKFKVNNDLTFEHTLENDIINKTLGDIFTAIDGANINSANVIVTGVDCVKNDKDWTESAITFTENGTYEITITDQDYCNIATATVTIKDPADKDAFTVKFPNVDKYLYRVGNGNEIDLGTLFSAQNLVANATVNIEIKAISGDVSGTYTSNPTWTSGKIQFTGTGVAKITIDSNAFTKAVTLEVEVVDAVNATTATSATSNNVVLLKDAGFSSLEVSDGYTLFGNGFTLTCGSDSYAADLGYGFVTLNNGTLDNVQIVCPNFDYAALYKSNLTSSENRSFTDATGKTRYYNARSGVMVSGNSQILNSKISGARAAVNVSNGNLLIENSRIEGGAVANILVGAANTLALKDVTLVQKPTESTYKADGKTGTTIMGFSVLLMCNSEGYATPVTIEGAFVQNAWIDESDSSYVPSDGKTLIKTILSKTDFLHDLYGDETRESLNLGFAYMPESAGSTLKEPTITDSSEIPYEFIDVSNAYVYSYKYSENESIPDEYINTPDYIPSKYSDVITVNYSDTVDGLTSDKSFSADGWVFELNVDLDKLSGYALDFSKLSMNINGVTVTDYKVNGSAKPTSPDAVIAGGKTYKLIATIDGKEYIANFKVTGTETSKESPSLVSSNYASALLVGEAGSTLSKDTWHGAAPALEGIQIKYWSVAEKQYKTITLSDYTPKTAGKQNGTNTTWTYSPDNGDFTLTLTGGQVHSSNNVNAIPVVCNEKLYFVAAASNGLVNYGNSARTIPVSYSFKDNNGGKELEFSHTWSIECPDKATAYDYSDFCNGTSKTFTIKASNGSGCVTSDTLVTLADGSQKRIDEVTYEDTLLVWDFMNGEYAYVPASVIFYHGNDNYKVISLTFDDGSIVKVISSHGFFDVDANEFVFIDEANVESYIGHSFVKVDGDSYTSVKLIDYTVYKEFTGCYSIQSVKHNNFMVEDMFSMTVPPFDGWFDYFEIGDGMKYDEAKMQKDIEKYGLYTYDELKDYVTYEQFIAFNGPYLKVLVGRGVLTFDDILNLIATYVQ